MFPAYDQYKSMAFKSPTSREPVMLALLNNHAAGHPDTGVGIRALHEVMGHRWNILEIIGDPACPRRYHTES